MLDSSGADLLEVVLSALVISSEIIFRHSIFCKKGIVERSGRLDGERKKVLQKSSALLGLSLAIPLFDLRAGIGVQRTPCLILAINQMLSREACLRKLLAQTCLVWQIASFWAAKSFWEACSFRSPWQSLDDRSRYCSFYHGLGLNLKTLLDGRRWESRSAWMTACCKSLARLSRWFLMRICQSIRGRQRINSMFRKSSVLFSYSFSSLVTSSSKSSRDIVQSRIA